MDSVRAAFARNGLYRSRDDKVFGGVVAGLGRRLGIEPTPARWLFVIALLVIPGSQLLVYPALWICMPVEGAVVPA
jgi:phage shock protein C